ncbi:PRDX1 protein, partial [Atractosteus spatula]|nr:PRDX1 protein [Atractosteus spatula]
MKIPLVADTLRSISKDYGVLKEDEGIAFRGLFIIDDKGILRQITINDLPVGRSVDETLRLVQAFQFTDKHGEGKTSPPSYLHDLSLLTMESSTIANFLKVPEKSLFQLW